MIVSAFGIDCVSHYILKLRTPRYYSLQRNSIAVNMLNLGIIVHAFGVALHT